MQVAECVNIKNIDKARCQAEVLKERREHVHGITLVTVS